MEQKMAKIESCLRLCAILLLVLTACLVGLDSQTKFVIYIDRKVSYSDLKSLLVLVQVVSVAAGYNLLQLTRCLLSAWCNSKWKSSYIYLAWVCYLLDQLAAYITFGATSAALEHSVLALTGAKVMQWMKWCNVYTRFCIQIGGSLACSYMASGVMTLISFISAFNLFRLYSPTHFLQLKG